MSVKVLHILSGLDRGGVSVVLMNLLKATDRKKVQMDFAVVDKAKGEFEDRATELGATVHHIDCSENEIFNGSFSKPQFMCQLYALIKENGYTTVHCHNNNLTIFALVTALFAGVKKRLAHSHNIGMQNRAQSFKGNVLVAVNRIALNIIATHKVGCSDAAARFLFGEKAFAKGKTITVYNGIDISRFESKKQNDIKRLLFIGRISEVKNPTFALKVFKKVNEEIPDTVFDIVANVNQADEKCVAIMDEMTDFVRENQLENSVNFIQPTDKVEQIMTQTGVLLMTSLAEGLPMVAIEAQCSGNKCFLSDRITMEVNCGGCTYLSLESGAEAWAEAVCGYIKAPQEIKTDIDKFDINNMALKLEKIYRS